MHSDTGYLGCRAYLVYLGTSVQRKSFDVPLQNLSEGF
jgi:hypothetical protein